MIHAVITGSGSYLPEVVVGKEDFSKSKFYDENNKKIDRPNDEIFEKFVEITEIRERRYIREDQDNLSIAFEAAKRAIEDSKVNPEELDYIIFASNYGNVGKDGASDFMPSMSARLKHLLQIQNRKCIVYDMIFGCPGFVESLILANTLMGAGKAKKILIVGSETLSRVSDPYDRNSMIFSDGAGAVVVETIEQNVGFISSETVCDNYQEINYLVNETSLNTESGSSQKYIHMAGRKIYEYALKNVPDAMKLTLDNAGYHLKDVNKILIHQANAKMDYAIVNRLFKLYDMPLENHDISPMTIQFLGNSSVATVPTLYDLLVKNQLPPHQLKTGDLIMFASVGASMHINSALYRMP